MWWTGGERGRSERRGRWGILARSLPWTWWSMPPWRASNGLVGAASIPRALVPTCTTAKLPTVPVGTAANRSASPGRPWRPESSLRELRETRETRETREIREIGQLGELGELGQREREGATPAFTLTLTLSMISCPGRIVRSFQTSRSSFSTNRRILRTNNNHGHHATRRPGR